MGLFFSKNKTGTKAKVIGFLNQKGGVGKTTMAFNTAHALANKGYRVLALDMDPQSNMSLLFGVELASKSIFHLLINSIRELKSLHTDCLVSDILHSSHERIDLLPASNDLSGFELCVAGINSPRQLILRNFLEKNGLYDRYDYIVIDSPPTMGLIVVNILCATDGVFVPFRPDEFSRHGLGHLYEILENVNEMGVGSAPKIIGHVPNLVDSRRKQEEDDLAKIVNDLKVEMKNPVILEPFYNRASMVKCQAQKKSVFDFSSKEFLPLQSQFNIMADLALDLNEKSEA